MWWGQLHLYPRKTMTVYFPTFQECNCYSCAGRHVYAKHCILTWPCTMPIPQHTATAKRDRNKHAVNTNVHKLMSQCRKKATQHYQWQQYDELAKKMNKYSIMAWCCMLKISSRQPERQKERSKLVSQWIQLKNVCTHHHNMSEDAGCWFIDIYLINQRNMHKNPQECMWGATETV